MIRPNANLERYKYRLSELIFTYEDSKTELKVPSNLIKSLSIVNDYENAVSPSYLLDMVVPKNSYKEIITNMNTMTITFNITSVFVGTVTTDKDNTDTTGLAEQEKLYAQLTLKAINENNMSMNIHNRIGNDSLVKNAYGTEDNNEINVYSDNLVPLSLYLYDFDRIGKYKINKSFVIYGGLNDCIYNLFKERKLENLLVDGIKENPVNNYIVPYGHLGDNLSKLNEYYGIYDYPYLFYMDTKRTYLINKGSIGKCLEKGELSAVHIYVEKFDESGSINQSGCYCDEENKIYILNSGDFEIVDNDSAIDYIAGGKITTVIRGTGEIKNDIIGDYDIEKTYVVNNAKQHSQLIYSIKETKRSISFVFENVDINIFTPNKIYKIIPDDAYYEKTYNMYGTYRLVSTRTVLTRQTEYEFKSSIAVTLHKI